MAELIGFSDGLKGTPAAQEVLKAVRDTRHRLAAAIEAAGDPFAADDQDETTVGLRRQLEHARTLVEAFLDAAEGAASGKAEQIDTAVHAFDRLEETLADQIASATGDLDAHGGTRR